MYLTFYILKDDKRSQGNPFIKGCEGKINAKNIIFKFSLNDIEIRNDQISFALV